MLRCVLEIRTEADALVGVPLATGLRGAGDGSVPVRWSARLQDDDGRVWRSRATRPAALGSAWEPAKETAAPGPALRSLRPLRIDVRAETGDGHTAKRTVTRRLLASGVQVRRWRGEHATLYLPVGTAGRLLVVDTSSSEEPWLAPAAALLASQGSLVLLGGAGADLDALTERLRAMPAANGTEPERTAGLAPPPGLPMRTATARVGEDLDG
jgi:hypothetical protein